MLETVFAFPVDKNFGLTLDNKQTFGLFLSTQPSKETFSPSFYLRGNDAQVSLFNGTSLGTTAGQTTYHISHVQQCGAYVLVNQYNATTLESTLFVWNFTNGMKIWYTYAGSLGGLQVVGQNIMLLIDNMVYQLPVSYSQVGGHLEITNLSCLSAAKLIANTADRAHLGVLNIDGVDLAIYDSNFEAVGTWKLSKCSSLLFEKFGEDFVAATISEDGRFSVLGLEQAEIIEHIYSVDLNFQKDLQKWKLVRMRVIEKMVTVLFVSDSHKSRVFQISVDSPKEPIDIQLEYSIEALDMYHADSNEVNILFFDRVSRLSLDSKSKIPVDVSADFLNHLVTPQVVNYYKNSTVKDAVETQRQKRPLIIDELLKSFSLNSSSFYPPSSEDKLVQLIKSVISCEDFEIAQKIAVLYYIASKAGVGSEFGDIFGLDTDAKLVIDSYREFDDGNYSASLRSLCLNKTIDFPTLILDALQKEGSKEDVRRFHAHFGRVAPSLGAMIDIDLDSAFKFAIRHDLMNEFMDLIFQNKREKELALLPAYGELDKYVDDAYSKNLLPQVPQDPSFYGIFLLSRHRYAESAKYLKKKKYLKFLDTLKGSSFGYPYNSSGLFIPVNKITRHESGDSPAQLIDYVPKPHASTPRRANNDSLMMQSLSPFSPPRPKNISLVPVIEVPVPPESVLIETGFLPEPEEEPEPEEVEEEIDEQQEVSPDEPVAEPIEEEVPKETLLPPKRKELLFEEEPPKEYLFKPKTSRSRNESAEGVPVQRIREPDNRVPEEASEDEFHDQSIHLESLQETPIKQDNSAMDTENSGWFGRITTWLTPFKSNADKRARTGSADYDFDKKVKSPRKEEAKVDAEEQAEELMADEFDLEEDLNDADYQPEEDQPVDEESEEGERPVFEEEQQPSESMVSEADTDILPRKRATRQTKSVSNSPEKPAAKTNSRKMTRAKSQVVPSVSVEPRVTRSAIKRGKSKPESENSSRASSAPGSIATTPVPILTRKKRAEPQQKVVVEVVETPRTTRRTASTRTDVAPDTAKRPRQSVKDTPVQDRRLPARRMITRSALKNIEP